MEVSPEFVKKVEAAKIESQDKVNLLLTKAGLKPASDITLNIKTLFYRNDGSLVEGRQHLSDQEIEEIISLVRESGLAYQVGKRRLFDRAGQYFGKRDSELPKYYDIEILDILIGRSHAELDDLVKAWENNNDELIGLAYGYPQTAVEAYIGKRKRLSVEEEEALPGETRDTLRFLNAVPSEDNWQEEVKIGQRNADFIKKISPAIYEETIRQEIARGESV